MASRPQKRPRAEFKPHHHETKPKNTKKKQGKNLSDKKQKTKDTEPLPRNYITIKKTLKIQEKIKIDEKQINKKNAAIIEKNMRIISNINFNSNHNNTVIVSTYQYTPMEEKISKAIPMLQKIPGVNLILSVPNGIEKEEYERTLNSKIEEASRNDDDNLQLLTPNIHPLIQYHEILGMKQVKAYLNTFIGCSQKNPHIYHNVSAIKYMCCVYGFKNSGKYTTVESFSRSISSHFIEIKPRVFEDKTTYAEIWNFIQIIHRACLDLADSSFIVYLNGCEDMLNKSHPLNKCLCDLVPYLQDANWNQGKHIWWVIGSKISPSYFNEDLASVLEDNCVYSDFLNGPDVRQFINHKANEMWGQPIDGEFRWEKKQDTLQFMNNLTGAYTTGEIMKILEFIFRNQVSRMFSDSSQIFNHPESSTPFNHSNGRNYPTNSSGDSISTSSSSSMEGGVNGFSQDNQFDDHVNNSHDNTSPPVFNTSTHQPYNKFKRVACVTRYLPFRDIMTKATNNSKSLILGHDRERMATQYKECPMRWMYNYSPNKNADPI